MGLISPKKIILPLGAITSSYTSSFEYTDPILNVPMTKRITTLSLGRQVSYNQHTVELDIAPAPAQLALLFVGMQALIKSCVDNAEDIKDRLLDIAMRMTKPLTEEERVVIMKVDFGFPCSA